MQQNRAANGNLYAGDTRLKFAMRALGRTAVSIYYQDAALCYQWAENIPDDLFPVDIVGSGDADLYPPHAADRLIAAKQKALSTGKANRFELSVGLAEHVRWFDIWIDPDRDAAGNVVGVVTTALETTEQKRHDIQLKNLLREVSHRSKNLLAIILSLASQTARSSQSVQGFVTAFSGRLQAIARAQDLVTDRDWRGALLSDLVERQIALFRETRLQAVTMTGDDVVLGPNASLYVGLALHELSAYAVRARHVTIADAAITVRASLIAEGEETPILRLEWVETGVGSEAGMGVEPLARAFLENVVPLAVDGAAAISPVHDGFIYRLDIAGTHIA